ncbi:MAG: ribonuclease PH, partial [Rhizobiaceae bacterium]
LGGQPVLDLVYEVDSSAGREDNFVMTGKGGIVVIQGTAEGEPFSEAQFAELMGLARKGIQRLVSLQQMAIA